MSVIRLLRRTLRSGRNAVDRWMSGGPFADRWQRLKWLLKYRLGLQRHVPDLATLATRPHRPILMEAIDGLGRVDDVLEVGCGRGVNLLLLARRHPGVRLAGIDVSAHAIARALRELRDAGVDAQLRVGGAEDMGAYGDDSMDVVIADAVTMYLSPETIALALGEMARTARLGVVISAWHADLPGAMDPWLYDEGTWVYDYARLLGAVPGMAVEVRRYPQGTWQDRRWNQYGCIVIGRRAPLPAGPGQAT